MTQSTIVFPNNVLTHVENGQLFLTFDDGPNPQYTPPILDTLRQFGAKACFFVCGNYAAEHPEIVRRMSAEGHAVGNHTWSHPKITDVSRAEVIDEIGRTQAILTDILGDVPTLFRPPHGAINAELADLLRKQFALTSVGWSVMPKDWTSPGASVIAERTVNALSEEGGEIVLLHDGHATAYTNRAADKSPSRTQTVDALPLILASLQNRNLVTISTPNG